MKSLKRIAGLSLAIVTVASLSYAQGTVGRNPLGYYGNGYGYRSSVANYYNPFSRRLSGSLRQSVARRSSQPSTANSRSSSRSSNPARSATSPARGGTTFQPVASMLLPAQLARESGSTPVEQQKALKFFSTILNTYKDLARQKGAPLYDMSRAASFMLIASYRVSTGQQLPQNQMEALREQMREFYATDAEYQQLSNRQKQEIYESYVILGMYLNAVYDGASTAGDQRAMNDMRDIARKQLQETFDVSADQLNFTDNGITIR